MELMLGSLLLRCDRGMFEVFSHARPEPNLRCPVRWVAVAVAFGKRGHGTPKFGTVRSEHASLYGYDTTEFAYTYTPLQRISREEEPALRAFMSAIAERYGRRMTAG